MSMRRHLRKVKCYSLFAAHAPDIAATASEQKAIFNFCPYPPHSELGSNAAFAVMYTEPIGYIERTELASAFAFNQFRTFNTD